AGGGHGGLEVASAGFHRDVLRLARPSSARPQGEREQAANYQDQECHAHPQPASSGNGWGKDELAHVLLLGTGGRFSRRRSHWFSAFVANGLKSGWFSCRGLHGRTATDLRCPVRRG